MHTSPTGSCFADTLTFVYVLSSLGLQTWYPGAMRHQTADAKYDWGLLAVLIADGQAAASY